MKNKLYLGLTGELLAGKTTAADFLVKSFAADHFKYSALLSKILELLGLEKSRKNYQDLGELLRKLFGRDVLTRAFIEHAKESNAKILLFDGFRSKEDLQTLKTLPNFRFIYIEAPDRVRFARMQQREEKSGENTQSFEQFEEIQKHQAESEIRSLRDFADYVIENSGSIEEFEAQLTKCVMQSL